MKSHGKTKQNRAHANSRANDCPIVGFITQLHVELNANFGWTAHNFIFMKHSQNFAQVLRSLRKICKSMSSMNVRTMSIKDAKHKKVDLGLGSYFLCLMKLSNQLPIRVVQKICSFFQSMMK